ncbi:MAG: endonuclease/exonuclease/phosphatase family protein, partial [Myxococcota bacterium]|nr:endonuclease/exonuclease/phosphatase family protein [Myxococcota bacterium]
GQEIITASDAQHGAVNHGDRLVVATWNIHYACGSSLEVGRFASRDQVLEWLTSISDQIRAWDADIVALQEVDRAATRTHDVDQVRWLMESTGMPYAAWTPTWDARWVPHPGLDPRRQIGRVYSGQVILSRFPLTELESHPLPQPAAQGLLYNLFYLHRALTEVRVDLGEGRNLRLVNAHLEAFDVENRTEHARRTASLLQGTQPLSVLLGDMNSVPPEASLRSDFPDEPETDMSEDRTLETLRSIEGLREVVPTEVYAAQESSWWTFPAHAPNRRLDYLFHGAGLALADAHVPRLSDAPSDHLPVVATFRIEP